MSHLDKTLKDLNRRNLNLREYSTTKVLPQFVAEDYPKLIQLLDEYYDFENDVNSPARLLDELFVTRDITQTDADLLQFIEDELLLGQSYFEGFVDKRAAAKYSNTLYRSKGSKYSIQQFFRTFFGIDPDVVYTKENMFIVGESEIGTNSQRFIKDDKLYQTYALLIKSELGIADWQDIYKLFVHPAGMYLGSEVQIVTTGDFLPNDCMPNPGTQDSVSFEIEGLAEFAPSAYNLTSVLVAYDSAGGPLVRAYPDRVGTYPTISLGSLANQYSDVVEFIETNSPSFDENHDGDSSSVGFSNIIETMDQEQYGWLDDSDSFFERDE
jgi:hypothetical protein